MGRAMMAVAGMAPIFLGLPVASQTARVAYGGTVEALRVAVVVGSVLGVGCAAGFGGCFKFFPWSHRVILLSVCFC